MANLSKGSLSTGSCVLLIVGACVGSAIFSISGITIEQAGPAAILSWLLSAGVYGLYGFIITKLALQYPRSGGVYVFPRRAIGGRGGRFIGYLSAWGYIISNLIAIAFSAIFLGRYLLAGFPHLTLLGTVPVLSLAIAVVILLLKPSLSNTIQDAMIFCMIAFIAFYSITAFMGNGFDADNFKNFFTQGSKGPTGFISAVPLAMVAYGGSVVVAFLAAEVKDPKKTMTRSLMLGLLAVAGIYILLITAIIGTLPLNTLRSNEDIIYIPVFATITHGGLSGFPWLIKIVSLCGALALFTTILALLRINARALQMMSAEGLFPRLFLRENKGSEPWVSLITMAAIAAILCHLPRQTELMITLGAVLNIITMTISCLSLIFAKEKKMALPIIAIAILWVCYIPDVVRGTGQMWIFTLCVYAAGCLVYQFGRNNAEKRVSGVVVHGKGNGRLFDMPTANLEPYDGSSMPKPGVWATRVFIDGHEYHGITHVGNRPTIDDSPEVSIETIIIDFKEDIYEKDMNLIFLKYIRPTQKFDSLRKLRNRIDRDIEEAWGK